MTDKISWVAYQGFRVEWFNQSIQYERFGQAFINRFFKNGKTDSDLFYEPSTSKAESIICSKYINNNI